MPETLWKILLDLKKEIYGHQGPINQILIRQEQIVINPANQPAQHEILVQVSHQAPDSQWTCCILYVKENGLVQLIQRGSADQNRINQLLLFLPFCMAPILTRNKKKSLSISHFAQSLDGHIATNTNNSKWIGNDENLIHAHRLRALVDAVIIGNKTLLEDQPKLTVRHVEGQHPVRVVIGSSDYSADSLTSCCGGKVIRITGTENAACEHQGVEYIQLERKGKYILSADILHSLYEKGIYSVLVEGGSYTSSIFLKERSIDILQLHISPLLFGSGIKTFNLPTIDQVDECCSFEHHFYHPVGDAIMFTGFVNG